MIRDNDFAGKNHRGMHPCRQGNSWNCSYDNLKKKKAHWENYQTLRITLENGNKNGMVPPFMSSKLVQGGYIHTVKFYLEDSTLHLLGQVFLKMMKNYHRDRK